MCYLMKVLQLGIAFQLKKVFLKVHRSIGLVIKTMMTAYLLFLLMPLVSEIQGGKLMQKLFQCTVKKREKTVSRNALPGASKVKKNVFGQGGLPMDENTKMRETIAKAEENLNRHYFQGDMMLTGIQRKILNNAFKMAHKRSDLENRAMIKDIARLWPSGTVPYAFATDVDEEGKQIANSAMKHWMEHTCVKFKPRTTEKDFVQFQFGDGCASRVGRLGGNQEILIGSKFLKCKVGNLIHELGHTLGFFHEHSRPDRDGFVAVKMELVRPGFEINFKKLPADWIDSRDVKYDYGSIMHYPRTIFGQHPWDETVVPLDQSAQVGQRIALSPLDILQAKKLYGCAGARKELATKRKLPR